MCSTRMAPSARRPAGPAERQARLRHGQRDVLDLGLQQRDALAVAIVRHDLPRLLRNARHLHSIHMRRARLFQHTQQGQPDSQQNFRLEQHVLRNLRL